AGGPARGLPVRPFFPFRGFLATSALFLAVNGLAAVFFAGVFGFWMGILGALKNLLHFTRVAARLQSLYSRNRPLFSRLSTVDSSNRGGRMDRREFLMSGSALAVTQIFGAEPSRYRIGYTSNTRGGWERDPFVGFREAHEVGFRWVEHFAASLSAFYPD